MKAFHWAAITALIWGMVPLLEKIGVSKTSVLTGIFLRSLGVCIGIILLAIFKFDAIKNAFSVKPYIAVCIITAGIMASFLGQIFFYKALKLGELSKVVPIAASYPLISFILGLIFLSEKLTLAKLSGVTLVFAGIMLLK